jgi:O-acetyl-ADP-ribose deacetylase (regulator of RNase III)
MQVQVASDPITSLKVDAVVNPTNTLGTMDHPVGEAIREAGGAEIETAAKASAPIAIGAALLTTAGDMPAKHILHVPITGNPADDPTTENIRRGARAALVAASLKKFNSIAIPCIDHPNLDNLESVRSVLEELKTHKKDFPATVYVVGGTPEITELLAHLLSTERR